MYSNRPYILFFSLLILFLQLPVSPIKAQLRGSSEMVHLEKHLSADTLVSGKPFRVALQLDIEKEWYINAHQPIQSYLIGTEVFIEHTDAFLLSKIHYPEPESRDFAFAGGEELLVYSGNVIVFLEFKTAPSLNPGNYLLSGSILVQACDHHNCLAPSRIPFQLTIPIASSDTPIASERNPIFDHYPDDSAFSPSESASVKTNEIESLFTERGLILAFLSLFFIGLALNLTPCVYPMLSVTVSLFGGQQESRLLFVFFKALIYVAGIATMYSVLGVLASFGGGLFGSWLQHPWVLGSIGFLLLLLSLGMFGLYELQVPSALLTKMSSGSVTGLTGIYLSGLAVGIFAAPCIGPPIIALLAFVGSRGDPLFGFWAFFILSLGLGFPYLLLGTFSGLLTRLPKSGVWMVWVKKIFGVALLMLALFYLSIPFVSAAEAYKIIPYGLIAGGLYLGFLESTGRGTPLFSKIKMVTGSLIILTGIIFLINLQKEGMEWKEYNKSHIQKAIDTETPVIIDFYADWCIPCLELERLTFTDERVINATEHAIRLKVDLTNFESPESSGLRRKYNIAGVPTILFLDTTGREVKEARITGFVGPDEFLEKFSLVMP